MKKTFIQALECNAKMLAQFVSVMKEEEIDRQIKDYWTIYQHIEHLVITQKVLLERMKLFIEEARPEIKPYNPGKEEKHQRKNIAELLDEFMGLRKKQIKIIKSAKKVVWEKEGHHPEYKKYSFEILIRHAVMHDGFHMWRMEELWIEKEDLIMELNSN